MKYIAGMGSFPISAATSSQQNRPAEAFHEAHFAARPIRDFGLTVAGTPLESAIATATAELQAAGWSHLEPHFYLSNEWGVPFGTTSVAIPFYLARPELVDWHGDKTGMVEGERPAELRKYLRHELGHVVNYGYRLYELPEWTSAFGDINTPYIEEYRPEAFRVGFVRHLPGFYAQKHPDEDWAETFAVWLSRDWKREYAHDTVALAKLQCCQRLATRFTAQKPTVTERDSDEDVSEMTLSLDDYYREMPADAPFESPRLKTMLKDVFQSSGQPAAPLIARLERQIATEVYRWTGHFPERTRRLLRQMAAVSDGMFYETETEATVALTALATSLAMTHVRHGRYTP